MSTPSPPGLIDILPPPPPPPGLAELLPWLGAALLILALLGYWLRRHYGRRARCRRALARLAATLHSGPEASLATGSSTSADDSTRDGTRCRDTVLHIAALLREALALHRLDPACSLPQQIVAQQPDWQAFLARLHQACYAPASPDPARVAGLCAEARDWIRRWPA